MTTFQESGLLCPMIAVSQSGQMDLHSSPMTYDQVERSVIFEGLENKRVNQ